MKLKPLSSLLARKRSILMASKLRLQQLHIEYGKIGMITADQNLVALAPFAYKGYFSRNVKKAYGNWTLGETVSGSNVSRIQGNAKRYQLESGTGRSKKIRNSEDSVMGDGFFSYKVLWADEINILFVNCFESKCYSGWSLFSTSRTLNRKTQKIVLDKICALGFNHNRAVVLPY